MNQSVSMGVKTRNTPETTMTPQDILDRFVGHDLLDEIEVSNRYLDYAEALYDDGKKDLAMDVFEMAYEEFTHARFQKYCLENMDRDIPDDLMLHYHKLKDRFREHLDS